MGRDGLLLRNTEIVGFSELAEDYREFLLQGRRSIYRVLVKGSQPIDHAIARNILLKLSPPEERLNPLRKWLLNPAHRWRLTQISILAAIAIFFANFFYRYNHKAEYSELVNFQLMFLVLLIGPFIGLLSAALHRHREKS